MDGMAANVWMTLTKNYGVFSEIATMNAKKQLHATELQDGIDFLKHVKDLREKWKSVTEKGAKIDNLAFRNILIASLPESWNAVVYMLQPNPRTLSQHSRPAGTDWSHTNKSLVFWPQHYKPNQN